MSAFFSFDSLATTIINDVSSNYAKIAEATERLSSGKRINSAADDPAGLAVSGLMRADIVAFNQGARNANDAVSLVQTADGAMSNINENLIHMKSLALQASTGTITDDQRGIINSEYQLRADEITRIANDTEFNGIKLLDGSLSTPHDGSGLQATGAVRVHFGGDLVDYYDIKIDNVTASALGVGDDLADTTQAGYDLLTQESAQNALVAVDNAIVKATTVQSGLGAVENRLGATVQNITNQAEHLAAAQSRIVDADIAAEMKKYTEYQVLVQVGTAMLAQTNSMANTVLRLIGA